MELSLHSLLYYLGVFDHVHVLLWRGKKGKESRENNSG